MLDINALGNAFISLEISSQFHIFFSLFSFILAWTFISLQIKEFRILGLSINDSVYSCLFFFLTGLHFFHLLVGLLLCCLLFWSSSKPSVAPLKLILFTSIFTFFFFGEIRNLTTLCLLNNNGFSLSYQPGSSFHFLSHGSLLTAWLMP